MDESRYITTKSDLTAILSKHPHCLDSTLDGKLIISYDELPNILINKLSKRKVYNIIANTEKSGIGIGHWFNLVIFNNTTLFLIDGLNKIKSQPEITSYIGHFSARNNLKLKDFSVRYQSQQSKKCGYLAVFFVYKSVSHSITQFLRLRRMLQQNSIVTNENYIFTFVKNHFKLDI